MWHVDVATISGVVIHPCTELIEAIKFIKELTSKEELSRFLRLVEYYSKLNRDFASKTHTIRKLLKKKVEFYWDDECVEEFERVKEELRHVPFLQACNPTYDTKVLCDASAKVLGAFLFQTKKGKKNLSHIL
ncbi:hypothetical protein NDU88_001644 [Pleurodeles waltl]|uniref:Reverse transcriptase/retrotransposon-derived protein RNase H-like domain-containing protein n=1 Tax=Pleurodeles waltl TaxID=8319 RepID=A0AAV7T011_PLEWA|nr:hypothetical protein NDU88_001644 [Pleurodeles waltl]